MNKGGGREDENMYYNFLVLLSKYCILSTLSEKEQYGEYIIRKHFLRNENKNFIRELNIFGLERSCQFDKPHERISFSVAINNSCKENLKAKVVGS